MVDLIGFITCFVKHCKLKMINIIQYIYYRIFEMHSRGEDSITAAGLAIITLSAIWGINIITIYGILFKTKIISNIKPNYGIYLGIGLLIMNFFLFMFKKKYKKIKQKFSNEQKQKKIKNGIFVLLYGLLSFILFFVTAFI
jgi:hypothetical protein